MILKEKTYRLLSHIQKINEKHLLIIAISILLYISSFVTKIYEAMPSNATLFWIGNDIKNAEKEISRIKITLIDIETKLSLRVESDINTIKRDVDRISSDIFDINIKLSRLR